MFRLFRRNQAQRVLIIGLDCASPTLVFERFRSSLPTLSRLMDGGTWGTLNSSIPCITVPAWSSMTTGRDPGVLGVYGFRNRAATDYDSLYVADSRQIKHKRIWDWVGDAGYDSVVMNVPQTYPVKPIQGHLLSGFLTPDTSAQFAYPAILKQEALKQAPDLMFDVRNFRNIDRVTLYDQLQKMTKQQYALLKYLLTHKPWQFAMHVNIGLDRIQHAFWRYYDQEHRLHEADSPFATVIHDYYQLVDRLLGEVIDSLDDEVAIMIVSDHGAKRMDGAIAINEWLWQNGWLVLKDNPKTPTPLTHEQVDWNNTRAWSTGGYYGRIFMNVSGREPQGIIAPEEYETVRETLMQAMCNIPDDRGRPLATTVYRPETIYNEVNGIAPDLLVYFGDLHWRCVGGVGYGQHYTLENDIGPDDANHAQEGLFILSDPHQAGRGYINDHQLMDVAPTALALMGIDIPAEMQGQIIPS